MEIEHWSRETRSQPRYDGEDRMLGKCIITGYEDRFWVPTGVTSNGQMSVAFDVVECPSLDIAKLGVLKVRHHASLIVVAVGSEGKMKEES